MGKKTTKSIDDTGGPYVTAAFFCEKLLEERDGIVSAIRIFDILNIAISGDAPQLVDGSTLDVGFNPFTVFVALKSGSLVGQKPITIDRILPSGKVVKGREVTGNFLGGEIGVNVRSSTQLGVDAEEGVHWHVVQVDGTEVTRMPLRVRHQQPTATARPVPPPKPRKSRN